MENKINIAELLKNCPSGMELDCTMYNQVSLIDVDDYKFREYPIRVLREDGNSVRLTKYGQYTDGDFAKCVIFPKGRTTWEGFVPPCKFKAGDVLVSQAGNMVLFSHIDSENIIHYHCIIPAYGGFRIEENTSVGVGKYYDFVLANEQQRQRMYDQIKCSGYKYNQEINKLEKLIEPEPKFKEGDILYTVTGEGRYYLCIVDCIIGGILYTKASYSCSGHFLCTCEEQTDMHKLLVVRLATEEEKQYFFDVIKAKGYKWNEETKILAQTILPKFKVGDKIRGKYSNKIFTISCITQTEYQLTNGQSLTFYSEDDYELVSGKFNFSTLIPFESKILVRDTNKSKWVPSFWGCLVDDYKFVTTRGLYYQCIPYEGNEHLMGKYEKCDDFYKIWE